MKILPHTVSLEAVLNLKAPEPRCWTWFLLHYWRHRWLGLIPRKYFSEQGWITLIMKTRMLISIVSHCIWFSLYFNYFMCMCKLVDNIALFSMRNDTNTYMAWEGWIGKFSPKYLFIMDKNKVSSEYISEGWISIFTPGKTCVL